MRPGPVRADAPTRQSLTLGRGAARAAKKSSGRRLNVHLCGFRFSPVRDPQRFPVCPRCKELATMLWGPED
jgi:Protein of unknown function (DUF3039)